MPKRFRNCVGPQVRALRKEKGLTQDQLAARLQLAGLHSFDRVTVAKIESQIRSLFDFEVIVIAEVLGVPFEKLSPTTTELNKSLDDLIAGEN
ncbi:MAG: helix-turn-helix transcriptional regulator [Verrucomicrobiota bacterium]